MNKITAYIVSTIIIIVGIGLCFTANHFYSKAIRDEQYKAVVLNTKNPIKTEAIAKLGDKLNEYYIQRFEDRINNVVCYVHKGSISCLKR
jgi:transposase-like protein